MREYKITNSSLGYKIYRKKEENGIMHMEWLHKDGYCLNIEDARIFYHVNDAMSALVIERRKCQKETPQKTNTTLIKKSELVGKREKKSWQEL